MSRIRGIEAKVQKDVLLTPKNNYNENKKKNEDQAIYSKDDVEKRQISELVHKLPQLGALFDVHRKVGEGTFSSVYLGSLRAHAALPPARRPWFALKHLVPTAHPARVHQELRCLQDMGGRNNVIGVELCLRHLDTIVFVMPYIPHKKFSEYVGEMDADELREYLRALVRALRHVHSFGVIHRDVKPSNFLYDRDNKRYLLVDFGLAQRVCPAPAPPPPPPAAPPPPAHTNTALKRTRDEDSSLPDAKRVALDLRVRVRDGGAAPVPAPPPLHPPHPPVATPKTVPTVRRAQPRVAPCACAGAGGVCGACAARPLPRAPRAGTQGFRPPEVLLKYSAQTTAVDMWACGVVLASVLCARYPLLRATDDAHALAELADLLGTDRLAEAASALGRRLVSSSARHGLCLRKLCAYLRAAPAAPTAPAAPAAPAAPTAPTAPTAPPCARCSLPQCLCRDDTKPATEFDPAVSVAGFPDAAFALAARLLEPDPRRRITAAQALLHPFLSPSCEGD